MKRAVVSLVLVACGGSGDKPPGDSSSDTQPDGGPACVRPAAPADRVRHVVVAHPYDAASMKSNLWEVLDLSATGELSRPNRMFTMGRAYIGEVAFTPDGKIGIAPQEDGSLGIFKLDDAGMPTVLHTNFKGMFYAGRVVVAPNGTIYILDDQWRNNGGGIYELAIDCNDVVTDRGLVAASKLPAALDFTANGKWVVAANDIGDSMPGADAHLLSPGGTLIASTDAFSDDLQIVGGATLTRDGSAFLIGDTSQYSGVPNRVAIVPVEEARLGTASVISNIEDPLALLASPFADKVLVVSGFGDAMFQLAKSGATWSLTGELTYVGAKPQLPGGAVMVEAGALRGLVLVAENLGVRRVEMFSDGNIVDRGMFSLGSGIENSTGAIGVTP